MNEKERDKMIKELVAKATLENPKFQEAMAKTADAIVPQTVVQPTAKVIENASANSLSQKFKSQSGISFLEMLTLLLIALKLGCGADVSWFCAFLPVGIEVLFGVVMLIADYVITKMEAKKKEKKNG